MTRELIQIERGVWDDEIRKAYALMAMLDSLRYLVSMIGPADHKRRLRAVNDLDKAIASAEQRTWDLKEAWRKRYLSDRDESKETETGNVIPGNVTHEQLRHDLVVLRALRSLTATVGEDTDKRRAILADLDTQIAATRER